jgi:hypothetical protein
MTLRNLFEERITLWKASSFEDAISKAEEEANEYSANTNCKYLRLSQAYELFDDSISEGTEVFSLMRDSDYSAKRYVDTYFDNGKERQRNIEDKPANKAL